MAFRYLSAGESHGPCLTVIVEGVPAGLPLTEEQIRLDLARRQLATGAVGGWRLRPTAPRFSPA